MVMLTAMCDVVDDADDSDNEDNDGDGDDGDGDNAEILMMVIIFVAASEVKTQSCSGHIFAGTCEDQLIGCALCISHMLILLDHKFVSHTFRPQNLL